jgi:enoyl-CoA hydratase/carnithine racemase
MEENHVLYSVENNVATITLNRPNRGNSLTLQMVNLVIDYFQRIKEDNNVRVVVLTGTNTIFGTCTLVLPLSS